MTTKLERAKAIAEVCIGAGGVAVAVIGIVFTVSFSSAEAEQRRQEMAIQNSTNQEAIRIQAERDQAAILEEWLPAFLGSDDSATAERMIVGLLPSEAESVFVELKMVYGEAGLLSDELSRRLDRAIDKAESAAEEQPQPVVDFGTVDTQEEADELVRSAEELGFSSVSVVSADDLFTVVVEVPSADDAEALLPGASEVSDDATVSDLRTAGPTVGVPNVYRLPVDEGVALLREAGFRDVHVWEISSNSVEPGRIRQVIVRNGAATADEIIVVDSDGTRIDALDPATPLAVKESTGSR